MKGRKLTIEEVKRLNTGDKVYIVPSKTLNVSLDNEGLANIEKLESAIIFNPKNGKNKTGWRWNYNENIIQNDIWLDIYEWTKVFQPKTMCKFTKKQRLKELELEVKKLKEEIEKENINEHIASCTMHRVEDICFNQHISTDKVKWKKYNTKETDFTIEYTRKGNKVICTFSSPYNNGIGISRCHPDDKFDYGKGVQIAELRARADFYNKVADAISY